jgi:hypothetical protein
MVRVWSDNDTAAAFRIFVIYIQQEYQSIKFACCIASMSYLMLFWLNAAGEATTALQPKQATDNCRHNEARAVMYITIL